MRSNRAIWLAGAAFSALTSMSAAAQTAPTADSVTPAQPAATSDKVAAEANGTDIVVTARKRGEERLQDIPASISAFSDTSLQRQGITSFEGLGYKVPGLTFVDCPSSEHSAQLAA